MEFLDLHGRLSDEERGTLAALDRKQAEERVRMLESIWPGKYRKLHEEVLASAALPMGQRAQKTGEALRKIDAGCLCGARFLREHWSEKGRPLPAAQKSAAVEEGFAGCTALAATALEACGQQKAQLVSPGYRQLQSTLNRYENTKKSTLPGTILPPAIFAVIWYLLLRWIGSPGFADFVAKPMWEEVSYAAYLILFFVFGFGVMKLFGANLLVGIIGGLVLDVLVMLFSIYIFVPLLTKLVPALENIASEYSYLLVFLVAALLVWLTFSWGLAPFLNGLGAFGKNGKLRRLRKTLEKQLAAVAKERQLYGQLAEMSVICEAQLRWEDASFAALPKKAEACKKLRNVRVFFRQQCQWYDRAQAFAAQSADPE